MYCHGCGAALYPGAAGPEATATGDGVVCPECAAEWPR